MGNLRHCRRADERGGVLINVIVVVLIGTILLAGIGKFVTAHYGRVMRDTDYAAAIDMAEAGANYELSRVTTGLQYADQIPGTTYYFGNGKFKVYCAGDVTGTTPWPPATGPIPNTLYVFATGTVNNISRTVRVSVRGYNIQGNYAIYGIHSLNLQGSVTVIGDIGANGPIHDQGNTDVQGGVYLNGSAASYDGTCPRVTVNPDPYLWPTVDDIVAARFPGGWSYLMANNDNKLATGSFSGTSITGSCQLTGKPGGANYYITDCNLTGNAQVTLHNGGGPINIWFGPSGANTQMTFNGTTDASTDQSQGGSQVNIYVATRGGAKLTMAGTSSLKANVYAYNGTVGDYYGTVTYAGTPDVYGTILGYDVALGGDPQVHYVVGTDQPDPDSYYGYLDSWMELNAK